MDKDTVVITGGAGDMGRAVAASFAADGFRVLAGDVVDFDGSDGVEAVRCDVTARGAVDTLAARAGDRLAVWVNAAGIVAAARIIEADAEAWHRIIAVNLTGCFHGCAAALRIMAGAGGGRIVNVGSLSGQIGGLGMHPAYGASKAGVHSLTRSYALEGAKHGVFCNAVAPSVLEGSMAEAFSEPQRAKVVGSHPLGRLGTMDDAVAAIRFLADPERAGYINGVVLPINGGAYLS